MTTISLIACATCMGSPGHQTTIAAGNAIIVMLWVLVGIALMLGGFVFTLAKRARAHARLHGIPTAPDPLANLEAPRKDSAE